MTPEEFQDRYPNIALVNRCQAQAGWLLGNAEGRGDEAAVRRLRALLDDLAQIDLRQLDREQPCSTN